jgi:hypothetical protein
MPRLDSSLDRVLMSERPLACTTNSLQSSLRTQLAHNYRYGSSIRLSGRNTGRGGVIVKCESFHAHRQLEIALHRGNRRRCGLPLLPFPCVAN